jgi:hypothetical protein
MVLKTSNAGQNWVNIAPDINNSYFWIRVSGNNILLYCNSDSAYEHRFLYKSINGGSNWNRIYFDSTPVFTISFLNDQTGWVFNHYESNLIFYKTTNGGNNWSKNHYNTDENGPIGKFTFVNENIGYAATYAYEIIKTTDGGHNWFAQVNQLGDYTVDVSFINPYTGWVICFAGTIFKTTDGGSTYINSGNVNIPVKFSLYQNYPNPFNPTTKIKFDVAQHTPYPLSRGEKTVLKVYDILGKEVATLVNEALQPGTYEITFDGSNLASGIYFYQLAINNEQLAVKKMVLLK